MLRIQLGRRITDSFSSVDAIARSLVDVTSTDIDGLIQRLIDAIAEDDSAREPDPSLVSMDSVRQALTRARMARDAGNEPAYLKNLEVAAYQISDSWPRDSALGADILGYIQGVRRR